MRSSSETVILLAFLCSAIQGFGQDKIRRVEQPSKYTYAHAPIHVGVNLDDKSMKGWQARAGSDWLKRLSVEITNTSGKDIKFVLIHLILREGSLEVPAIVVPLELGNSEPEVQVLMAGARTTLKPVHRAVDLWVNRLKEQGVPDVDKVFLDVRQVGFTDGTEWFLGRPTRTDP